MHDFLAKHLYELEQRLLEPGIRGNRAEVGFLLASEFREFGSSGHTFDKTQILDALEQETNRDRRVISQFEIQILALDVVLATYRVTRMNADNEPQNYSLRSSIWKLYDRRWQMIFHQGTLTPEQPSQL